MILSYFYNFFIRILIDMDQKDLYFIFLSKYINIHSSSQCFRIQVSNNQQLIIDKLGSLLQSISPQRTTIQPVSGRTLAK